MNEVVAPCGLTVSEKGLERLKHVPDSTSNLQSLLTNGLDNHFQTDSILFVHLSCSSGPI